MIRAVAAMLIASLAAGVGITQPGPVGEPAPWKFDEITLTNGAHIQGLMLEELPDSVRFQSISRPPGRPTVTLKSTFARTEIAGLKKLSEADRRVLQARVAQLDRSGEGERQRMESLELVVIDWPGKPSGARRYESEYFVLESSGSEELTRRSAVRLEQIYTAFIRFLPPATLRTERTKIMLATDREEYRALLGAGEASILNPAVFDPTANRIICWNDLKRLGDELQTTRLHHAQQLAALKQYEESIAKLYKDKELERFMKPVGVDRQRIWKAETENGDKFDRATARLFAILYHEAFHAYVGSFLYPALKPEEVKEGKGPGELPRWLNEGLAQLFETSIVEAGELRADSPDRERLLRVKDWVKGRAKERLVPLADLLVTGKDAFLAVHADQRAAADRAYLTSWALAYYLTFERRMVGTREFHKYLAAVNSGGDPRRAFSTWAGRDLEAFEKQWHSYLLRLQSDGRLSKD